MLCLYLLSTHYIYSQLTTSNPAEYTAITEGNVKINGQISAQTEQMLKVFGLQSDMVVEFKEMKSWENKYNAYLKGTNGFAEAIVAGADLYAQGVMTLQRLHEVKNAIGANPQGVAASVVLNDLYVDASVKLLMAFNTIKDIGEKSPDKEQQNMLTGEDRVRMLWVVNDSLKELHTELHKLAISIAYYNLMDVWREATKGLVVKDHGTIARQSLDSWKMARRVNQILNQ